MTEETTASQTNTEEVREESSPASILFDEQPQDEIKEDEVKQEADVDEVKEEDKGNEKPEDIIYDVSLNEGSQLKQGDVDGIVAFSKQHGLSNEVAKAILAEREIIQNDLLKGFQDQHEEKVLNWLDESKNDSEIGGENLKLHAEQAKRALEQFGSEEFKSVLTQTGFGNHPEVIRIFSKIGKLIQNDEFVPEGKSGATRSRAEILYGNTNQ